jgi:hypothetical protein
MNIITFDTTGAIDEIKTGKVMESADREIQNALKIISVIVRIELLSKPKLDAGEYAKRLSFLERVSVIPLNKVIRSLWRFAPFSNSTPCYFLQQTCRATKNSTGTK